MEMIRKFKNKIQQIKHKRVRYVQKKKKEQQELRMQSLVEWCSNMVEKQKKHIEEIKLEVDLEKKYIKAIGSQHIEIYGDLYRMDSLTVIKKGRYITKQDAGKPRIDFFIGGSSNSFKLYFNHSEVRDAIYEYILNIIIT